MNGWKWSPSKDIQNENSESKNELFLLSLRDPNSVRTLSAFRKGVDWAKSGQFSQQDIDEAKLSVFSAVDSPVAPADKGETLTLKEVVHPLPKLKSDVLSSLLAALEE